MRSIPTRAVGPRAYGDAAILGRDRRAAMGRAANGNLLSFPRRDLVPRHRGLHAHGLQRIGDGALVAFVGATATLLDLGGACEQRLEQPEFVDGSLQGDRALLRERGIPARAHLVPELPRAFVVAVGGREVRFANALVARKA